MAVDSRAPAPAVGSPPSVLLFGLQMNHAGSCRLPKILKAAGFRVGVAARRSSLLHLAGGVDRHFTFAAEKFAPGVLWGIERAVREFRPDLLVPCDERGAAAIRYWVARERTGERVMSPALADCLRRSLGDTGTLDQRAFKTETLKVARAIGIRAPAERIVADEAEALAAGDALGYPVVAKVAHGAGGNLVRAAHDSQSLLRAYRHLRRRVGSPRRQFRRWLLRRHWYPAIGDIAVQAFVAGRPAMACAAARDGRMLGVITGFAEEVSRSTGPSTVVRLAAHDGMAAATAAMIQAFGATGFVSFDFIIDADGREHLIECNARPIQVCHLGGLVGVDLAGLLAEALAGRPPAAPAAVNGAEATVALFPQEWHRQATSPALTRVYHDAPWDEPRLLRTMIERRVRNWREEGA